MNSNREAKSNSASTAKSSDVPISSILPQLHVLQRLAADVEIQTGPSVGLSAVSGAPTLEPFDGVDDLETLFSNVDGIRDLVTQNLEISARMPREKHMIESLSQYDEEEFRVITELTK